MENAILRWGLFTFSDPIPKRNALSNEILIAVFSLISIFQGSVIVGWCFCVCFCFLDFVFGLSVNRHHVFLGILRTAYHWATPSAPTGVPEPSWPLILILVSNLLKKRESFRFGRNSFRINGLGWLRSRSRSLTHFLVLSELWVWRALSE